MHSLLQQTKASERGTDEVEAHVGIRISGNVIKITLSQKLLCAGPGPANLLVTTTGVNRVHKSSLWEIAERD